MSNRTFSNSLVNETSPYLLQHAHNPVQWYPWGVEALEKARREDKLLLISIGYSSCHWCHVMERESFEDIPTAELMNEHYVCIKVDREERPDIDQLYMTAVQLMTRQGGWPLNCFALPDGRPVYGGTYFPRTTWQNVLKQLADLYRNNRAEMLEYAAKLNEGLVQHEALKITAGSGSLKQEHIHAMVNAWRSQLDFVEGGPDRAPKFPMPVNLLFLLRYSALNADEHLKQYVHLTLRKMAMGGIYDQAGGGFARYSTDAFWKVPHFEKMLYDNAQLLSLYAEAHQQSPEALYEQVCFQTIDFLHREMKAPEGYFYSALDADSEGEEGKFYVWTEEELKAGLSDEDYRLLNLVYDTEAGKWEHNSLILIRNKSDDQLLSETGCSNLQQLYSRIGTLNESLLHLREGRERPGLDDKLIVSWNALLIRGFSDVYRHFGRSQDLEAAEQAALFILNACMTAGGELCHTWKGAPSRQGFVEDYALLADAFVGLYQAGFDENWLLQAEMLCSKAIALFSAEGGMFFTSAETQHDLVIRQVELQDNVIPAPNSIMAVNLFRLGVYFGRAEWLERAGAMLALVQEDMKRYGAAYGNWASLSLNLCWPFAELAVTGKGAAEALGELRRRWHTNLLEACAENTSNLPFLQGRVDEHLQFFLCDRGACRLPVRSRHALEEMLETFFRPS